MSGGPLTSVQEVLITSQVDGTALTNSTTATSIIPSAARFTLASNFFWVPGKSIRVSARGRVSTVTVTPGTLTLDVRLGTVATPIVVFNGGAISLNTTAQTNDSWEFETILTCRAIGSGTSANLIGVGSWTSAAALGAAAGIAESVMLPATAPAVGTGFDSTITNVVDFFATWSIANASNSIQVHQYILESLN